MENQDNNNTLVQNSTQVPFYKRMSKGNFIFFVASYSVIAVLILTTILLAVIPTYTGVKFETAPDYMVLQTSDSKYLTLYREDESTKEDFYKVWNAYNASGNPVVIDTIFNGYAGKGKTAVYSQSNKYYNNLAKENTYAITFHWNEKQTMTNGNGSQFTYTTSSNTEYTDPTYYTDAYFAVDNVNKAALHEIYLRKDNASTSSTSTKFYYTGYANFISLYEVVGGLEDAGKFTA